MAWCFFVGTCVRVIYKRFLCTQLKMAAHISSAILSCEHRKRLYSIMWTRVPTKSVVPPHFCYLQEFLTGGHQPTINPAMPLYHYRLKTTMWISFHFIFIFFSTLDRLIFVFISTHLFWPMQSEAFKFC